MPINAQEMFMLFFSILYGIMLNSVIGLRAFPLTSVLAGKDYVCKNSKCEPIWKKGRRSRKRLVLSIIMLNILPFSYFAIALQYIEKFVGDLSLTNEFWTIAQVLFIGFISLGVFAFYRFYVGLAILTRNGNHCFYTEIEYKEHVDTKGRRLYPSPRHFICAGFVYLIPFIVMMLILRICPFFCN